MNSLYVSKEKSKRKAKKDFKKNRFYRKFIIMSNEQGICFLYERAVSVDTWKELVRFMKFCKAKKKIN